MALTIVTHSDVQTMDLAEHIAGLLEPGECVLLEGPLGSGKTCFVRGMARGMGLDDATVSSPTFTLCQTYGDPGAVRLHHIDAYRLKDAEELEAIGFDEMVAQGDAVIAVEWPSRIEDALPDQRLSIEFGHVSDHERELSFSIRGIPAERACAIERAVERAIRRGKECPVCRNPVQSTAATYPFCSDRCRLSDLGNWFSGRYTVSRSIEMDDYDEFQDE